MATNSAVAEDKLLRRLGLRREAIPGLIAVHRGGPYIYIDLEKDIDDNVKFQFFFDRINCHPEYITMMKDGEGKSPTFLCFGYPDKRTQADWHEVLDPVSPFCLVLPVLKECTLTQDEVLAICNKVDWEDEMMDGSYWIYDPKFQVYGGNKGDGQPDFLYQSPTKLGKYSMFIEITGECVTNDSIYPPPFEYLFEDDWAQFLLRLADPGCGGDPRLLLDTEGGFAIVSNPKRTVNIKIEMQNLYSIFLDE